MEHYNLACDPDIDRFLTGNFLCMALSGKRPDIERTTENVWGGEVVLYNYETDTVTRHKLDTWTISLDLYDYKTIEQLIGGAKDAIGRFEMQKTFPYKDTKCKIYELADWRLLADENGNVHHNRAQIDTDIITLVKFAKILPEGTHAENR